MGFFSKYPFKKESRTNKTVLYEGSIDDVPDEFDSLLKNQKLSDHKFCIIYNQIKKDE